MIGLFFEVLPKSGHRDSYFDIAAGLRPELDRNPGLKFIDRYESLDRPDVVLSHSLWLDEAHLVKWRANSTHYKAQVAGRQQHFEDYRIRIGGNCAHFANGESAITEITQPYNAPDQQSERYVGAVYMTGEPKDTRGAERFKSVYREDEYLVLISPETRLAGLALAQEKLADKSAYQASIFLISRDYGMLRREEAPQYLA